jgi:hypothetical protein
VSTKEESLSWSRDMKRTVDATLVSSTSPPRNNRTNQPMQIWFSDSDNDIAPAGGCWDLIRGEKTVRYLQEN